MPDPGVYADVPREWWLFESSSVGMCEPNTACDLFLDLQSGERKKTG